MSERTHLNGNDEHVEDLPSRDLLERTYVLVRTRQALDGEEYAQRGILIRELGRVADGLVDVHAQLRKLVPSGAPSSAPKVAIAAPAVAPPTIPPPMRARLESLATIQDDDPSQVLVMREKIAAVLERDAEEIAVAKAWDRSLKKFAIYAAIGAALIAILGGLAASVGWAVTHVR